MGYNVRENVHGNAGVEGMNFFHLNFFFLNRRRHYNMTAVR